MTVEELRKEAKAMGYNITPISPKEKLLFLFFQMLPVRISRTSRRYNEHL